jgi:hypothetical protein
VERRRCGRDEREEVARGGAQVIWHGSILPTSERAGTGSFAAPLRLLVPSTTPTDRIPSGRGAMPADTLAISAAGPMSSLEPDNV